MFCQLSQLSLSLCSAADAGATALSSPFNYLALSTETTDDIIVMRPRTDKVKKCIRYKGIILRLLDIM